MISMMNSPRITPRRIIVVWLCLFAITVAGCLTSLPQASSAEKSALVIALAAAFASLTTVPFFFLDYAISSIVHAVPLRWFALEWFYTG